LGLGVLDQDGGGESRGRDGDKSSDADGKLVEVTQRPPSSTLVVDLDPLLFLGKVGSAFTRLSSNELANVTAGGGMVPTFIIDQN